MRIFRPDPDSEFGYTGNDYIAGLRAPDRQGRIHLERIYTADSPLRETYDITPYAREGVVVAQRRIAGARPETIDQGHARDKVIHLLAAFTRVADAYDYDNPSPAVTVPKVDFDHPDLQNVPIPSAA